MARTIQHQRFTIISSPNRLPNGGFSINGRIFDFQGNDIIEEALRIEPPNETIFNSEGEADNAFIQFAIAWIDRSN